MLGRLRPIALVVVSALVLIGCEQVYYNFCRGGLQAKGECARIETTPSCNIRRINGGQVREAHVIIDVPSGRVRLVPHWTTGGWDTTSRSELTYELKAGHSYVIGVETPGTAPGPETAGNPRMDIRFYLRDKDTGEKIYPLALP
jgi:hypothetical protein